jgi:hypothetical protein
MNSEYLLWIAVAAYAAHILEEFTYNWKSWVTQTLGVPVDWPDFYVTNAAVVVLGICCAQIGWRLPEFSLIYPSLMLVNALFFHLVPTIFYKRFSPGLITALVLFLPIADWTYYGAYQDGVLTTRALVISLIGSVLTMVFPVALMRTKGARIFRQ